MEIHWNSKKPLYILGKIGIGKSATVLKMAKKFASDGNREFRFWNKITKEEKEECLKNPDKYFVFLDLRLATLDLGDLRLPKLDNNDMLEWKLPMSLYYFTLTNASGLIFFDEMNLAPPALQGLAYSMVWDRFISEYPFAKDVLILAAGNRLEDRANVFEINDPLKNRFSWCELGVPSIDEWKEWALNNGVDSRIITYLLQQRSHLFNWKPNMKENAFATPRTWEVTSHLIKSVKTKDLETLELIIASTVGRGVAIEFLAYLTLFQKLPDIEDILEGKADIPKDTDGRYRNDLLYCFSSNCADWFKTHNKEQDVTKILLKINEIPAEFALLTLHLMKGIDENTLAKRLNTLSSDSTKYKTSSGEEIQMRQITRRFLKYVEN